MVSINISKGIKEEVEDKIISYFNEKEQNISIKGVPVKIIFEILNCIGIDTDVELNLNGWEGDFWFEAIYNKTKYEIDGSFYSGEVNISIEK